MGDSAMSHASAVIEYRVSNTSLDIRIICDCNNYQKKEKEKRGEARGRERRERGERGDGYQDDR